MWTSEVELQRDVSPADWIGPRLVGELGSVRATVPAGFEVYARILHPVGGAPDAVVTWGQVAEVTGRRVHPQVQWHALIGANDPWAHHSDLWSGGEPEQGNLALDQLLALGDVLAAHTATPGDCFFALWEGWGQLTGGRAMYAMVEPRRRDRWLPQFLARRRPTGVRLPPLLSREELAVPRVRLPHRDHLLFRGPLSAMDAFVHYDGPGTPFTQSPSLFWPADRAWCVASEIDFDSTLVAGTAAAIGDVVAHPTLEALRLTGTESLRHDADTINT